MRNEQIDGKISQANGRLKHAKVGVAIERRGERLVLRAVFPPRPGSSVTHKHQQRLSTGNRATISGLKLAEQEARIVGTLLEQGRFSWEPYMREAKSVPVTCEDWIAALHSHYIATGGLKETWLGDYWRILKRLPQAELPTPELLHRLVISTSENSRTRLRACVAIGVLSKFAGVDYNPSPYRGNYSPTQVEPRDLPSDTLIAEWFYQIKNPAWRWVYGMIATYGLRNHEVFRLDLDQVAAGNEVLTVLSTTKTGTRNVWAYYPEWWEEFKLAEVQLPNVDLSRSNQRLGNSVSAYFGKLLPFKVYDLRHCWAVRTLVMGLDYQLAAKQMGHSVQVHERTYHRWVKPEIHQQAHEAIKNRSDRPRAPKVYPSTSS